VRVASFSNTRIRVGQAHNLIKIRKEEIKETANRDTLLWKKDHLELATKEHLKRFCAHIYQRKAMTAVELFFRVAQDDLADMENSVVSTNEAGRPRSSICR